MSDERGDAIPTISKPEELLALHDVTAELFDTLRTWFAVPPTVEFDVTEIDSAVRELGDPQMIAAFSDINGEWKATSRSRNDRPTTPTMNSGTRPVM